MGRGKFLRSLKQRWWILLLLVLPITLGTLLVTMLASTKYQAFMTLADRRPTDVGRTVLYQEDIIGRAVNDQEIRVLNLANTVSSYTVLKGAYDELTQVGVLDAEEVPLIDFVRESWRNRIQNGLDPQVVPVAEAMLLGSRDALP